MPEEELLGYALKQAQSALERAMDVQLRPLGLSVAQYAALNAVDRLPGAANADLARAAFVTPQTMHGVLQGLERQGLVARRPDPDHGRRLVARLSPRGEATLAQGRLAVAKVERRLDAASVLPRNVVLDLLLRLRDAMRSA